jgi:hypothetical protein
MFLGFSGVFPLSSCSPILVSSLYTSCMLRGAFYAFYKILYLLIKKKLISTASLTLHGTIISSSNLFYNIKSFPDKTIHVLSAIYLLVHNTSPVVSLNFIRTTMKNSICDF